MKEYTFKCINCGNKFDGQYQGEANVFNTPPCVKCDGSTIRVYVPPAISFKGGGFTRSTGA